MFNITDGNNNISRDKPVEHSDLVIGFHVSACTSCTRTMRVRQDIAIDITESVELLVRFNALRSMPVMPKLEHYNVDALRMMAAAALATKAAAANARAPPRLAGQCEKWLTTDRLPAPARVCLLGIPAHGTNLHGLNSLVQGTGAASWTAPPTPLAQLPARWPAS